jgi:hypothetical protein
MIDVEDEMFMSRGRIEDLMYEIHQLVNGDVELWDSIVSHDFNYVLDILSDTLSYLQKLKGLKHDQD